MCTSKQKNRQQQNNQEDLGSNTKKKKCCRCHMNSLGSLGYCVTGLGLTTYILATEIQQFIKYLSLPWPDHSTPYIELNIHIGLVGAAAVLLCFFFCAAVFKIGNYANDGYRLGVQDGACSKDPPPLPGSAGGLVRVAWLHGGPTAPFVHLLVAHLLIMARLIMEAAGAKANFLPQSTVWWSELSTILPQKERSNVFNRVAHIQTSSTPTDAGPVSARHEASTSVTFQADFPSGRETEEDDWHVGEIPWGPFTPHFINYVLAHLIYAGRYAGVFWGTNKGLGLVFLLQLLLNAAQSIFAITGFQVLYKVHVLGPEDVLEKYEGFLLPFPAVVAVFSVSQVLVLASGSVLYLYGLVKFHTFLSAEKEKYHILSKHGHKNPWSYWPHCWALTVLVFMTAAASPLVHDWFIVYNGSGDTSVFAATIATVTYLFLWILLWFALTLKSRWYFKLRVQISKTIVTSTHSIRLVNEVQLSKQIEDTEGPVMVIGAGKTYLLQEGSPKRSLMKLVMHTVTEKKARGEEEEIYWLRPKPPTGAGESWNKRKHSPGVKHKVTFDDTPSTSRKRDSRGGGGRCPDVLGDLSDSDTSDSDGDYARLRDVSFPGPTRRLSNKKALTLPLPLIKVKTPPQVTSVYSIQEEREDAGAATSTTTTTTNNNNNNNNNLDVSLPESECVSVGGDFPAPPPELTDPAHYPPPPTTPPPPLPDPPAVCSPPAPPIHVQPVMNQTVNNTVSHNVNHHNVNHNVNHTTNRVTMNHVPLTQPNPQINILRGNSMESSPGRSGDSAVAVGEAPRCSDSSSTASSVSPPDKRCDSGIHSQASYSSSSASHSKSGSSGSESCVPIPPGGGPPRCSSVDNLCKNQPPPPPQDTCVKSLSLQRDTAPPAVPSHGTGTAPGKAGRLNIEVVGGGYGFLPPSKFVASEPVYSDASTPVVIKRRSSVTAVEPDTPPYERSGSSFSTFTEPQLPRAILRGNPYPYPVNKSQTVAAHGLRARRLPEADAKHATLAGVVPPKGFHQPGHIDSRYFSVPAVKPPGTRVHPAPTPTLSSRTPSLH